MDDELFWCSDCNEMVHIFRDSGSYNIRCMNCHNVVTMILTEKQYNEKVANRTLIECYCPKCHKVVPIQPREDDPHRMYCVYCGGLLVNVVFNNEYSFVDDEDGELVYCLFCQDKVTVTTDGKCGWCDKCHRLIL